MMRVKQLKSLVLFLAIAIAYPADIYSMRADTLFIINVNTDSAIEYNKEISHVNVKNDKSVSPYALPYSMTGNSYDWHRLWIFHSPFGLSRLSPL